MARAQHKVQVRVSEFSMQKHWCMECMFELDELEFLRSVPLLQSVQKLRLGRSSLDSDDMLRCAQVMPAVTHLQLFRPPSSSAAENPGSLLWDSFACFSMLSKLECSLDADTQMGSHKTSISTLILRQSVLDGLAKAGCTFLTSAAASPAFCDRPAPVEVALQLLAPAYCKCISPDSVQDVRVMLGRWDALGRDLLGANRVQWQVSFLKYIDGEGW